MFSNETELGWDDSMKHTSDQKFLIRIGEEEFITESMLCDISAEEIDTRATRVWKARDKTGNLVVVKDVWLDETQTPEDALLKDLIETESDKEMEDPVKQALFNVVCSGRISVAGRPDNTREILHGLQLDVHLPSLHLSAPQKLKVQ